MNQDLYTGAGYHTTWLQEIAQPQACTEDINVASLRAGRKASDAVYTSASLEHALETWQDYNCMRIKSWDLAQDLGSGGTIVRFEHSRTHRRTEDFALTLAPHRPQRLRPNMDRLREEIDCALIAHDSHVLGGLQRWSGATRDADMQLIVVRMGTHLRFGWICVADQYFMPVETAWRDPSHARRPSQRPSWDVHQSLRPWQTLDQALTYQRWREAENK